MNQKIEKAIEIILIMREDSPSLGAEEAIEVRLWDFLIDNYVALKNGELENWKISELNEIYPGWNKKVETELISIYDEFRLRILNER